MPRKHIYDVIVVGSGLFGSSAFYNAAKISSQMMSRSTLFKRPAILGIEQFQPNHTQGSSHGESRITRVATGEGPEYVQLAKRSHEIWREIEKNTRYGSLCHLTGGLIISSDKQKGQYHGSTEGFLQQTRACASKFNIEHQNLSAQDLRYRFPQFKVDDHESGYLETKTMGYIRPDMCIKAQLDLARLYGAELHTGETVLDFTRTAANKIIVNARDSNGQMNKYETKKLILTAGSWTPNLLKAKQVTDLKVYRQTLFWFEIAKESQANYAVGKFPPFIWAGGPKGNMYGFPMVEGNFIKIGAETFIKDTTPCSVNRTVTDDEVTAMYENHIKPNFIGITPNCLKKATCLYTVAPGHRFMIDYLPNFDNCVIVVSACSGHGAKHSAAVGEAVAQLSLLGNASIDVIKLFGGFRTKPAPVGPALTY